MRHTFIPPTRREFDIIFLDGVSKGGGLGDIKIFQPVPIQRSRRGGGLFNILSGIARKAAPFLIRTIAPEAIKLGRNVLGDVLQGTKFKESLKSRGVEALRGVGERVVKGGARRGRKLGKAKRSIKKKNKKRVKGGIVRNCYKNDIFSVGGLV